MLTYKHPQGSTITVDTSGLVVKRNPAGRVTSTSATAAKLAAGHGGWQRVDRPGDEPFEAPGKPVARPARVLIPMRFQQAPATDLPAYLAAGDEWLWQQKLDGIRGQLVLEVGKPPWMRNTSGQPMASSTAAKVVQPLLRRVAKSFPCDPLAPAGTTWAVDGEIVGGRFYVFDFITDPGDPGPLRWRLELLDKWYALAVAAGLGDVIALVPTAYGKEQRERLVLAVHDQGGEGWIVKRAGSPYTWGGRVDHSLKIKLTHTVDAVVTARNVEAASSFSLGLYDGAGELVPIGSTSAIGKPDLPTWSVIEVTYLYASQDFQLTQPRLLRARPDKPAAECTLDQLRFADKTVIDLG